jgi:putative component of toxin-antitoxin plasmid stabilization module
MEVQPRDIQRYSTPDGKVPFSEWLDSLRDLKAKFKIERRLDRVGTGNFGDY